MLARNYFRNLFTYPYTLYHQLRQSSCTNMQFLSEFILLENYFEKLSNEPGERMN